jgi:hypothetical protein
MRSGRESMAGETSSRPTIAGFEISTRATPGISASECYKLKSKVACDELMNINDDVLYSLFKEPK